MKSTARIISLLVAVTALGIAMAQGAHEHEHEHDHGGAVEGARLIVSDAQTNTVRVLDATSGEVVGTFTVPGTTGGSLAVTGSGQYAVVGHRDANRVSVIHSGLISEDHGDHAHLLHTSPYVVATMNVGRQPTHLVTVDHRLLVFNDQDGSIAILDENLFGLSLTYGIVDTVGPDHGAPLLVGDFILSGQPGTEGVDVYEPDGNLVDSAQGCPGLHGALLVGDTAVFGCRDGVLLAELHGEHFHWHHVPNPAGSAEGARVATLYGRIGDIAIGNFGAGIALVDVSARQIATIALPGSVLGAVVTGRRMVALTSDGSLSLIRVGGDGAAELQNAITGIIAPETESGRPGLAALGDHVFVTDPVGGAVMTVNLHDNGLEVGDSFTVPGSPAGIRVLMLDGDFESH